MSAALRAIPLLLLPALVVHVTDALSPMVAGLVIVTLFVVATVALEGLEPTSLILGAAAGVCASTGMGAATAIGLSLVFATRSSRARSLGSALLLSGFGCFVSAAAVTLVVRFSHAPTLPRWTALAMASLMLLGPLVWIVDDRIAVSLRRSARAVGGVSRRALLRGLALRRREQPLLPRASRRQLESAWRSFARLGEAAADNDKLGAQLALHARALTNAHRAAMDVSAYRAGIGESGFTIDGDLCAEASALREVTQAAMTQAAM